MKKFSAKEILIPVISLFLICGVATFLLAMTNDITAPIIAEIDAQAEKEARKVVLPDAADFEDKTVEINGTEYAYCEGVDENGDIIGYVFVTAGKGYGGEVSIMTGRDADGAITGIEVLSCDDETPGLGQNAKKDTWRAQFTGIKDEITVVKNTTPEGAQILAITSATITSTAVTSAVNETLEIYNEVTKGGEQ